LILFKNDIIATDDVLDAETLPEIRMPNRDGFVPARPDWDVYKREKAKGKRDKER